MGASASPRSTDGSRRPLVTRPGRPFTGSQLALLVSGFLVNIGTFSVYPYLAVLLRERMGAGMAQVGVVLGIATLVQFASAPIAAAIAERIGLQRALLIALALYCCGATAYLAGADSPTVTIVGLFLSSCAASLYSPAYRSYLVHNAGPEQRPRLVSAGNAAGNLGIACGPVTGALFIHDPGAMFATIAALYAILTIGHLFLRRESPAEHAPAVEPLWRVLHGLAGLPFAVTVLTLYLHMQFYQYLAIYAEGRVPTVVYGASMMAYSVGLAAVQPLLARWVGRVRYPVAMVIGFAGLAVGMLAFAGGVAATIAAGVLALSVGNGVLFLKNDLEALDRSRRSPTVVFGQQRLAAGLGSFLSGVIGGNVYGLFERADYLPGFWLAVAVQCALLPPLVLLVARRLRRRTPGFAGSP
jgi:MFS family permease